MTYTRNRNCGLRFLPARWMCLLLGACLLLFVAAWAQSAAPQPGAAPAFREEPVAEMTAGSSLKAMVLSGDRMAWVEEVSGKKSVRFDGKPQGGAYDDVKDLALAPGAAHVVFFGKRGSSWTFVLDGQEQQASYDRVSSVTFRPGATSYAFVGCQGRKCRLTVDGTERGAEYEEFSFPQWTRDGKKLAHFGKRRGKWIAVIDGKETPPELDDIWGSAWGFTRDGNRFYVAAKMNGKWAYVVDGVPGPAFDVVSYVAFTGDGQHYAYAGAISRGGALKKKVAGTVVKDGNAAETYEGGAMAGSLTVLAGAYQYMIGGVRNLRADFHGLSSPWFSPDGKVCYAVRQKDGNVALMIGSEIGPAFNEILSGPVFTRDGAHVAYIARNGSDFLAIHDGALSHKVTLSRPANRFAGAPWIQTSADGAHLVYAVVSGGEEYGEGRTRRALRAVVIDGKAGPEYDAFDVVNFNISEDRRHYHYTIFGARGDRDIVNVDGHESPPHDYIWNAHFDQDGKSVKFLALNGRKFVRVTCPLQ